MSSKKTTPRTTLPPLCPCNHNRTRNRVKLLRVAEVVQLPSS